VVLDVAGARIKLRSLRNAVIDTEFHTLRMIIRAARVAPDPDNFNRVRRRCLNRRADLHEAVRMHSTKARGQ